MSKRDSEEMANAVNTQPAKKQKMLSNHGKLAKELSNTSIDMINGPANGTHNAASSEDSEDEVEDDDLDASAHFLTAIKNIGNVGSVSNFVGNQIQSIHVLGSNTVELSHSHNDGSEAKVTQQIVQQLTQLIVVSNFRLLIPHATDANSAASSKRGSNGTGSFARSADKDGGKGEQGKGEEEHESKLSHRGTEIVSQDDEEDAGSEDNVEEITKNDEICRNKIANLLKYTLENSGQMGQRKIRQIDIEIEGFKGTRANKFRCQSTMNTPTASFAMGDRHPSASSVSSKSKGGIHIDTDTVGSIGCNPLSTKNKTDRLIHYRDEINEKLMEYTDIILLFPDDNFDVLLNLFEYLRLCELGRTRNTSNPLFSDGIESMGKVLIFNLNGFYDGLNRQFNCYDEDKVENRFVVVVVDSIQQGIQRLKMWNRD